MAGRLRPAAALFLVAASSLVVAAMAVACGQTPAAGDSLHADREAYTAAIARGSDPNACAHVSDAALQSECLAFVAHRLAQDGRPADARTLCRSVPHAGWREECAFLVADGGGLPVDETRALCAEAGRLERPCLGHLVRREAEAALVGFGVGEELEALAAVQALVASIRPQGGRAFTETIVLEHLAGRDPGARFGRQHCGALDVPRCARVYQHRVQMAGRGLAGHTHDFADERPPWLAACDGTRTPARVEALGLPGWTPEMTPVVEVAWHALCGGRR